MLVNAKRFYNLWNGCLIAGRVAHRWLMGELSVLALLGVSKDRSTGVRHRRVVRLRGRPCCRQLKLRCGILEGCR